MAINKNYSLPIERENTTRLHNQLLNLQKQIDVLAGEISAISGDYVPKKTTKNSAYIINNSGNQDVLSYSQTASADTIAVRETAGRLNVGTPTANTHATPKNYVDTAIAKAFMAINFTPVEHGEEIYYAYPTINFPYGIVVSEAAVYDSSYSATTLPEGTVIIGANESTDIYIPSLSAFYELVPVTETINILMEML